jgi:hypothetical protein
MGPQTVASNDQEFVILSDFVRRYFRESSDDLLLRG